MLLTSNMRQTPETSNSTLNTETSIQLSQSMDSVNTTPEEEVCTLSSVKKNH